MPPDSSEPRPTMMDVNLDALGKNFRAVQEFVGASQVMPIVKANAYGHGLVRCVRHLEAEGARWFGVACVEEGIELRQAGVQAAILVLGGVCGRQIKLFLEHDLDITASSVDKLQNIDSVAASLGKRARVHLKVDTGMERVGVHYYSVEKLFNEVLSAKYCDVVGIYSHLATADCNDSSFAQVQLERFYKCIEVFERLGLPQPVRHIANSGAILRFHDSHLDLVRPGLLIYGIAPFSGARDLIKLEPVMRVRSEVVFFKVVKAGNAVSYGQTWTAPKDTRVVTVPIGYGDGYLRRLSNRAQVLIRGKRYPVVGLVCMDQLMVDIGTAEAFNGDEVVLIGGQGEEIIRVEELSQLAETTPHEVLVATNLRIPRRYY